MNKRQRDFKCELVDVASSNSTTAQGIGGASEVLAEPPLVDMILLTEYNVQNYLIDALRVNIVISCYLNRY
jgi:hypothetical protein